MKITLEFAELHTPLFLGGKNHGLKLKSEKPGDSILVYDQQEKELLVTHAGKTAIIPCSNVVSMTPKADVKTTPDAAVIVPPKKKISAQLGSPTMHVFAEAPGRTHD